jgi:hypothetical protein
MTILRCHVQGRQSIFVDGVDVGAVRVQKRDSASVAVLRSTVHGRAPEGIGSGNISATLDQKENNFVVAILRGCLQSGDAVVFYPHLIGILSAIEQFCNLLMREKSGN